MIPFILCTFARYIRQVRTPGVYNNVTQVRGSSLFSQLSTNPLAGHGFLGIWLATYGCVMRMYHVVFSSKAIAGRCYEVLGFTANLRSRHTYPELLVELSVRARGVVIAGHLERALFATPATQWAWLA